MSILYTLLHLRLICIIRRKVTVDGRNELMNNLIPPPLDRIIHSQRCLVIIGHMLFLIFMSIFYIEIVEPPNIQLIVVTF